MENQVLSLLTFRCLSHQIQLGNLDPSTSSIQIYTKFSIAKCYHLVIRHITMENGWTWSIFTSIFTYFLVRSSSIFYSKLWRKKNQRRPPFPCQPGPQEIPGTTAHTQLRHGVCVACSRRCPVISREPRASEERPRVERTEDLTRGGVKPPRIRDSMGFWWTLFGVFFMGFGGDSRMLFSLFFRYLILWDVIWSWAPTIFKTQDLTD